MAILIAMGSLLTGCGRDAAASARSRAVAMSSRTTPPAAVPDADDVLGVAQVRPTWDQLDETPALLSQPGASPSRRDLDRATSSWRTRGSLDDEVAWITAHPPAGYEVDVQGAFGGGDRPGARVVTFDPTQQRSEPPHLGIVYTVAEDGTSVVVRIDGNVSMSTGHF